MTSHQGERILEMTSIVAYFPPPRPVCPARFAPESVGRRGIACRQYAFGILQAWNAQHSEKRVRCSQRRYRLQPFRRARVLAGRIVEQAVSDGECANRGAGVPHRGLLQSGYRLRFAGTLGRGGRRQHAQQQPCKKNDLDAHPFLLPGFGSWVHKPVRTHDF